MHREELVGIQTIWWVDYQLAVGFLTGSWKSNMDVWISNQLFGNPTACLSWPRCNGAIVFHSLPTMATVQHKKTLLLAIGLLAAGGLEVEKTAPRRRRNH